MGAPGVPNAHPTLRPAKYTRPIAPSGLASAFTTIGTFKEFLIYFKIF
jgi:hypothetical protein